MEKLALSPVEPLKEMLKTSPSLYSRFLLGKCLIQEFLSVMKGWFFHIQEHL